MKGEVYIKINELTEEVVLQNFPFEDGEDVHTVHVACRKSKISGKERPLVDTAGDKYCSFLDINQKIEVNVYKQGNKGQVIIRPLEYKLFTAQYQLRETSGSNYYLFVQELVWELVFWRIQDIFPLFKR